MSTERPEIKQIAVYARALISKARATSEVIGVEGQSGWFQTTVNPGDELAQIAATLVTFAYEIRVEAQWPKESPEEAEADFPTIHTTPEEYTEWMKRQTTTERMPSIVQWSQVFESGK